MDQGPAYPPSEHRDDAPTYDPIMDHPPDPVEIDLVIDIDKAEGNADLEGEVDRAVDDNSHTKKFVCSPLGRRFLGIAMMNIPKLAL